jgi:hypothetical protein
VTDVAVTTVKEVGTKHKLTSVAPVKFVPAIVTVEPTPPLPGEKPLIDGDVLVTTNAPSDTAVPPGVVTRQRPSHAPAGTTADTEPGDTTLEDVGTKHKLTPVAPDKFAPEIVTDEPTPPLPGENPLIDGEGAPLSSARCTFIRP